MHKRKIQQIFLSSCGEFLDLDPHLSPVQEKAVRAVLNCKTGKLGVSISRCPDCGHMEFHNNSCRNRNCPYCQAIQKNLGGQTQGGSH